MVRYHFLIVLFSTFFVTAQVLADCQGCCSWHSGVVCSGGTTKCGDGTLLSTTCASKGCNVCGSVTIPTPINGVCGSAHNGVFNELPSESLCSAGIPNNLTGTGLPSWKWSCLGLNGGITATCNATRAPTSQILKLDYNGFSIWQDCSKRGAVKFQYNAQQDTGNSKRYDTFFLDKNVPLECQQLTTKAYGQGYDRGHLVPANHLDATDEAIKSSNTMTNILPQPASMNRGAWLETEEIIECYRDIAELLVIGGVIWGNNSADDYFIQSHGVATPDAFWKVIIRGTGQDERAIAWIVPNSKDAKRKNLNSYQVTIDEIEKITGEKIPVADYVKPTKSNPWTIPYGCNKS